MIEYLEYIYNAKKRHRVRSLCFYTIALEQAALELNATGYFQKQQELQMNATVTCTQMETKSRSTTRLDEKNPYVGNYTTNGYSCTCSWFATHSLCRHLIFYRFIRHLLIFDINMFKSFLLAENIQEPRVLEEAINQMKIKHQIKVDKISEAL